MVEVKPKVFECNSCPGDPDCRYIVRGWSDTNYFTSNDRAEMVRIAKQKSKEKGYAELFDVEDVSADGFKYGRFAGQIM